MTTTETTTQAAGDAKEARRRYYDDIAPLNLAPLWESFARLITPSPASPAEAFLWRYDEVRPWLLRAGELISAKEAERRVLILENPGLPGQASVTHSLYAGLQLILPGEVAPSHRHAQSALRFIMEGEGAYTAVEGERAYMRRGDLILTPSWTWHDHGNQGDGPTIWLDGLDIPLVRLLDASFLARFADDSQPVARPSGFSAARFGRNMRPFGHFAEGPASPVFSYPYAEWRETLETLRRDDEWDACHGLKMEFINPLDGGPVMPTISAFVQLLPKGFATDPYRSTDGVVYSVVDGEGEAVIGDQAFDLHARDVFVVPSWTPVRFAAGEDLALFGFSDRGVQVKLGLWREQRGRAPGAEPA